MAATEPITIRTAKETVGGIDALAAAMDRSRNWVVNQALEQYLAANSWQIGKIRQGLAASRKGRVEDGDVVLARIVERLGGNG